MAPTRARPAQRGGTSSGQHARAYDTRVGLKIRGPANLAGAWSAQPVPASPRPPRAAQGERSTGVVSHSPHTTPIVTGPQQAVLHMLQGDPHTSWRQTLATRSRICASHAQPLREPGAIPGVPHRWQRMPRYYSASGSQPELDVILNTACPWREQPLAVAEATACSTRRASSRTGRRRVVTPARIGRPHAAAAVTDSTAATSCRRPALGSR